MMRDFIYDSLFSFLPCLHCDIYTCSSIRNSNDFGFCVRTKKIVWSRKKTNVKSKSFDLEFFFSSMKTIIIFCRCRYWLHGSSSNQYLPFKILHNVWMLLVVYCWRVSKIIYYTFLPNSVYCYCTDVLHSRFFLFAVYVHVSCHTFYETKK